jgi:hypothetical protein
MEGGEKFRLTITQGSLSLSFSIECGKPVLVTGGIFEGEIEVKEEGEERKSVCFNLKKPFQVSLSRW